MNAEIVYCGEAHLTGDRLRDWNQWGQRRIAHLLREAAVADVLAWTVRVYSSSKLRGTPGRLFHILRCDVEKRIIDVEISKDRGGYTYRCHVTFGGNVGFEVVAQRVTVAANRLSNTLRMVQDRGPEPEAKIELDQLVGVRDRLNDIIGYAGRAKAVNARLAELDRLVLELREAARDDAHAAARDELNGFLEHLDATLAALSQQEQELRARVIEVGKERMTWDARLTAALEEQQSLRDEMEARKAELQATPDVGELLRKLVG